MAETARELKLEVNPEDVTQSLHSHDKTLMDEGVLLRNEQRKWLHKMESTPGKEAMKIVETTTKDVYYDVNLVDKTIALEKTDFNFESSNLGKMLCNSTACMQPRNYS